MATPSEILIPVRRRHEDTRTQIEAAVTQKQQWGYVEDDDLLFIRRKNKTRRYFSRNILFRPNSVYQPSIIAEQSNIQINLNAYYDSAWKRYDADYSWQQIFSETVDLYYSAAGAAGGNLSRDSLLKVSSSKFLINDAQRDLDFQINSETNQNSLFIRGNNGHIGINKEPNANWSSTLESLVEYSAGTGATHEYAEMSTSSVHQSLVNCYYNDAGGYVRKGNGYGVRVSYSASQYDIDYDVDGGVAGSAMAWNNMFSINYSEITLNSAQEDIDIVMSSENRENTLFVWGEKDNVGIHTATPLDNVGTTDGDFAQYGYGLHINTPVNGETDAIAFCIIEGGQAPDGVSPVAAALILCDNDADTDEKMVLFSCGNETAKFASLNDDVSASIAYTVDNILTMDLSNGYIGIGKAPSTRGILSISLSTDDLTIIDADDSVTSVGSQTAVIEVDVGTDQNKYIAVYDQPA